MQVWTPKGYDSYVAAALDGLNPLSDEARKLNRFFAANSLDTELDAAGRVGIPSFLLEHGELPKEVVVTGAGDCLEVWGRAAWADYNEALSNELPDIARGFGHPA